MRGLLGGPTGRPPQSPRPPPRRQARPHAAAIALAGDPAPLRRRPPRRLTGPVATDGRVARRELRLDGMRVVVHRPLPPGPLGRRRTGAAFSTPRTGRPTGLAPGHMLALRA